MTGPRKPARQSGMLVALQHFMDALTEADLTFLFLLISACLGACFVWAFWELEQSRERRRERAQKRAWRS